MLFCFVFFHPSSDLGIEGTLHRGSEYTKRSIFGANTSPPPHLRLPIFAVLVVFSNKLHNFRPCCTWMSMLGREIPIRTNRPPSGVWLASRRSLHAGNAGIRRRTQHLHLHLPDQGADRPPWAFRPPTLCPGRAPISSFERQGQWERALLAFQEMQAAGMEPTLPVCNALLSVFRAQGGLYSPPVQALPPPVLARAVHGGQDSPPPFLVRTTPCRPPPPGPTKC